MSLTRRSLDSPEAPGLHLRGPVVRLSLTAWAVGGLLAVAARLVRWTVTHPRTVALLVAAVALWRVGRADGWGWVAGPLLEALSGLVVWRVASPPSFTRRVALPARAWWRRTTTYRRDWQPAMVTARLDLGERLPRLGRVRSTRQTDTVRIRMLPGQTVADYAAAAPRLRQTFGLLDVRPRAVPGDPHGVELLCLVDDPLVAPVPLAPPAEVVDLTAVPVGRTEDGRTLALPILGSHWLVAGETGAGKGSVLWSLILGLAPAVRAGLVRLWVIDPKGGMELAAGAPLFDRFVYGGTEQYADLLDEAVAGLRARAGRLRGLTRKHEPTPEEPLVVVIVDELASLTAYVDDAALRRRIANSLSLLLSQGRAPGVAVVAATQDARKEVVGMRDLFPARVALRTAEPGQADLILGRGARDRGARTDGIPDSSPGVAFVVLDDAPEPVRVRFGYADDAAIREAAHPSGRHAEDS